MQSLPCSRNKQPHGRCSILFILCVTVTASEGAYLMQLELCRGRTDRGELGVWGRGAGGTGGSTPTPSGSR